MTFTLYIGVQLVAYGIDVGSFYFLANRNGAGLVFSNVCAKCLAGIFAYSAHRYVTFRSVNREPVFPQLVMYIGALVFNTILGSGLLLIVGGLMKQVLYAKFISDLIAMGTSFAVLKEALNNPATMALFDH